MGVTAEDTESSRGSILIQGGLFIAKQSRILDRRILSSFMVPKRPLFVVSSEYTFLS